MEQVVTISEKPVLATEAHDWLSGQGDAGAVVMFTGHVRDEQGQVAGLELEHFPGMAESELAGILDEAAQRWSIARVWIQHRVGALASGELIVLVGVATAHRQAAFQAAAFIMDFLKTRVPIWKKTVNAAGEAAWVEDRQRDRDAAARWREED